MREGDSQDNSFESADAAQDAHYNEFGDELRRFGQKLNAAKQENERNIAETKRRSDEAHKSLAQMQRRLNQISLQMLVGSVEVALAQTEKFIEQWRVQFGKIQNRLSEEINSFKNPGWMERFFSWFEFPAVRKASEDVVIKLESLSRTDTNDPYNAYKNFQQTIENILSSDTITYRLKWRLKDLLVEMKNHSLPALMTDSRFSDITIALTKPDMQDMRKNYQTVFYPVEVEEARDVKYVPMNAVIPAKAGIQKA